MKERKKINVYHSLFTQVVKDPRAKCKDMAIAMGRVNRGQTISSVSRQLHNMYKDKVSFKPRLVLGNYKEHEIRGFFCKKGENIGIAKAFSNLIKKTLKSEISLGMWLSGQYDFLVMTRKPEINLSSAGIEIEEEILIYEPIYTIPGGWENSMSVCVKNFLKSEFKKGKLERSERGILQWEQLQWDVYNNMYPNLRAPFKRVAKKIGVSQQTVSYNLNRKIIPCCVVANFFFPFGYKFYEKILLRIDTEYEESIVKALQCFHAQPMFILLKKE